jgi:hypothetical protein
LQDLITILSATKKLTSMRSLTRIACACCLLTQLATAQVSITADRDNTIYSESGSTSNGAGEYLFLGRTNRGDLRRSLVHFDLASIPAGSVVTTASLVITCNKTGFENGGVDVYKLLKTWGEAGSNASANEGAGAPAQAGDATWSLAFFSTPASAWSAAGGDFAPESSGSQASLGLQQVSISSSQLIADVQSWINNPAQNFGWILRGNEQTNGSARRLVSKESANNNDRPKLIVSFSSLPLSVLSFEGQPVGGEIILSWTVAADQQPKEFLIERSGGNGAFSEIGRVPATNTGGKYTFRCATTSKTSFFRLLSKDKNGEAHYSKTIFVNVGGSTRFTLGNNPVADWVRIKESGAIGARFRILEANGRCIKEGVYRIEGIPVSQLATGSYFLQLASNTGFSGTITFLKE